MRPPLPRYGERVTTWSPQDDLGAAEQRADVKVRTLIDLSELDDARWVFDTVWPSLGGFHADPVEPAAGADPRRGYASAAYRNGEPIGAAFAFVGRHRLPTAGTRTCTRTWLPCSRPTATSTSERP